MILTLLACTPPVEAPAEVDELSAYLYANFNGTGEDGEGAMPAGLLSLETYLLSIDLAAEDVDDRAFSLSPLVEGELDGATYDSTVDLALQLPVAVPGQTTLTMEEEVGLMMEPNQVCIASNTTAWSEVVTVSGGDCFESGECDLMETTNEFLIDSISDGWLDVVTNYRWVELEDGRMAVVARGWMPEKAPALSGDNSWDTRFTFQAWIPSEDGSTTERYYAFWSSVSGVPDDLYTTLVVNGLDEYFLNTQAYVAGEECSNDRDREYDRE